MFFALSGPVHGLKQESSTGRKEFGGRLSGSPRYPWTICRSAEQRQDVLRRLVGDAQGLRRELLLDLQGLEASGLLVHVGRSEEHTSELQSLMRISYAVFCLKKKKNVTRCVK